MRDFTPTADVLWAVVEPGGPPQDVEKFLKFGGDFTGVVSVVIEETFFGDDIFGHGSNKEQLEEYEEELDEDEMIPKCRNDPEFVLLARKLGTSHQAEILSKMIRNNCSGD